ncbi:hypothetical protein [Paenibacillus polymyxa]|uniref:hypothetical protein n=1 Tax=Paenibacillus polymyxa TaxID=1406 RepID=UPI001C9E1824|nr:hypothetical protein [Paenibacillus polymyxa]MBY7740358.1 hypothetical protein [Paenibacillus polymyxa]
MGAISMALWNHRTSLAGVHIIKRILIESRKQKASYLFDQDSYITDKISNSS